MPHAPWVLPHAPTSPQVRSVALDTWLPDQVAVMEAAGNGPASAFFEANLPHDFKRPNR